jgi:hypothetical protein
VIFLLLKSTLTHIAFKSSDHFANWIYLKWLGFLWWNQFTQV